MWQNCCNKERIVVFQENNLCAKMNAYMTLLEFQLNSAQFRKCGEKNKTRTQIFWLFKAGTIKVCHGNCLYKKWASSDPKKENKVNHLF